MHGTYIEIIMTLLLHHSSLSKPYSVFLHFLISSIVCLNHLLVRRIVHKSEFFKFYKVHSPTNAHFIKLDRVLKFTLKITLACSYMFRSTTTFREPSLELS